MNICLVSAEYPPETGWGGIGTYVYNIAQGLIKSGHKVWIIAHSSSGKETLYEQPGMVIWRLPSPVIRIPFIGRYMVKTLQVLRRSFTVFKALRKLLNKEKLDLIEFPEWRAEGFVFCLLKPKLPKIIVKLHTPRVVTDEFMGISSNLDSRLINYLERFTVKHADSVNSPSESLANLCREKMKLSIKNIAIVPYPVDTDLFSPAPVNHSDFASDKKKTVLYTGRLEHRKGIHILANIIPSVVKALPEVTFKFIGADTNSGPGGVSMKSYILKHVGDHLRHYLIFLDRVERTSLVEYYRAACICVFPSLYENFPYTCLEAMACGKAVLASNSGGMAEIIDDGYNGILFDPNNPESLAQKMIYLLTNSELISFLGQNAVSKIQKCYGREKIVRETVDMYGKLSAEK